MCRAPPGAQPSPSAGKAGLLASMTDSVRVTVAIAPGEALEKLAINTLPGRDIASQKYCAG